MVSARLLRPQMVDPQLMMLQQRSPGLMPPQQQMAQPGFAGYGTTPAEAAANATHQAGFKFPQEDMHNMMTFSRSNSMPY